MNENNPSSISFLSLLTLLFIGLKLSGNINWSWFWVLSPIIIPLGLVFVIIFIAALINEMGWFIIYYHNKKLVTFDIETQGLDVNSNLICIVTYDGENYNRYFSIEKFMEQDFEDNVLVGFNSSKFDLPFIRTKCIKENIPYTLNNVHHLDIYNPVRYNINTTIKYNKVPSKSNLYKSDLQKLAKANELEYKTKRQTYAEIKSLENPNWLNYIEEKHKDKNSLQDTYQLFFDVNNNEEYIDGADTDKLLQEGKIGEVIKHCDKDVLRTYKVTEKVYPIIPNYDLERVIKIL